VPRTETLGPFFKAPARPAARAQTPELEKDANEETGANNTARTMQAVLAI